MPKKAKFYITAVTALGLTLLAASLASESSLPHWPRYLAYLALAAIASTLKVRLPRIQGTISVNFLFLLLGIAQLTLFETLGLGCLSTVIQCLWKAKKRPQFIQVQFNVCALVVSISAAWAASRALTPVVSLPIVMALAASLLFVANTVLVSLVLALLKDEPLSRVWRHCYLWTFPYYLVGAVIAGSICVSSHSIGWAPSLMILPLMYLVYSYYRFFLASRTE
ncbi:MAG: hypothetical protein HY013_11335 [Candidatus Solibacter usitatus]|nr:hypothetical protein [Candidatus Solibacter usitatus]